MRSRATPPRTILVSACLLGLATRDDGTTRESLTTLAYLRRNGLTPVPVCPEQLAGLPTPRPRCWYLHGDGAALLDGRGELVNEAGQHMEEAFLRGASATLQVARLARCTTALLKEGSPSCAIGRINRSGTKVAGMGVTAALLQASGISLLSDEALPLTGEETGHDNKK